MSDRDSLEQDAATRFVAEWSAALAREKEIQQKNTFSALLFRIGMNLFALSTKAFREVVDSRPVHTIPHRTNDKFLGIVNIRGSLHLCVNVGNVLRLSSSEESAAGTGSTQKRQYSRMVVIESNNKTWAFEVNEILSLQRFPTENVVSFMDEQKCTRGIVEWRGKTFDVLDEQRFFQRMDECV